MAAIDDLHAAIQRGHIPVGVLAANGITGADADLFKNQVEERMVNPVIPATVATALGLTAADVGRDLTRNARLTTSGR